MQANTALTSAYSDSIYIFICFLVFFWLFKAIRRFYRTLLLRQAYNTESIVQISGLGSYLSYFDGATSSHLHSIVHTRQTKPPVDMSMMLVPCSLLKSTLSTDGERSVLELQINVLVPGKVILMSNFNMRKFRIAVANESQRKRNQQHNFFDATNNNSNNNHHNHHHHHTNNVHNVSFRDSLFSLDQQSISTLSDTRKYYLTRLADLEVCDRACVKYDCNTGIQTIQFTFIIPRVANGLPPVGTEIPNTQGKKEGKRQRSRDKRDSRDSEAPRVSATDPVQPAAATPATPPVRTGNEIFTIGIAFLPNSTEYSPRLRHNSGDLIRDRESVDKSRSSSRESPGKTSTVIFDRQDASNKETTSAFNGTGSLNFRSYFSLGTSEASSKGTSTKRLVVPVEPDSASNNNYTPNNTDHSGDSTQGNGRQQRFSMSQIAAQTNRRSEVTAASIFTFQFPVNILSLFQDTSSSNASTATNNATSPENLMQIENSSNPVIERSTSRDRTSSPSKRINGGGVYPTKTKEILPKALTLMDKNGRIFNSLEIFGLGSLNEGGSNVTVGSPMDTSSLDDPTATNKLSAVKGPETAPSHKERSSVGRSVSNDSEHYRPNSVRPTTSADADLEAGRANSEENNTNNIEEAAATPSVPITPSTSAIFQGGKFTKEECVVCLTDPKNVVLIPCRHLCVCSSCLTYVDKCPVCRAFFEEYVVINYDNSISVSAP